MRKLDLLSTTKDTSSGHFTPGHTSVSSHPQYQPRVFSQFVSNWNSKQVARWIEGLSESVRPWLGLVRANIRNGKHLLIVDDDYLSRIGITSVGPRKIIIQAIQLLQQFCDEMLSENLQLLAMRVVTSASYLSREMIYSQQRVKETAEQQRRKDNQESSSRAQIVAILNDVTTSISNLIEHCKRLIFWLDRSPFDEIPMYVDVRNKLTFTVWDLLRLTNVTPKILFNSVTDIVKRSNELADQCDYFVRYCEDPLVISTSYVEKVSLRRHDVDTQWGINLLSSYKGVHVVSEVKIGSPADLCGKVDAGDEIMVINGETVIGWDLSRVASRLGGNGKGRAAGELHLVLKKRPKEAGVLLLKEREAARAKHIRPLAKAAPGSQLSTMDRAESVEKDTVRTLPDIEYGYPVKRRRSSTYKTTLSKFVRQQETFSEPVRLTRRRASVSGGSPPPRHADLTSNILHVDLLALFGPTVLHDAPRVMRRARTMRHQPDGYVRSFVDNQVVRQADDELTDDPLPFNTKCPAEFAAIEVVDHGELSQMGIVAPMITDPEWVAPFKESTDFRFRSPMGDSNISTFSLDSPGPGPRRMASSSIDEAFGFSPSTMGAVASPSSSVHSLYGAATPTTGGRMSFSPADGIPSPADSPVPPTPDTPCTLLTGKTFEGWVRRRKTGTELATSPHSTTNKWPKCWMALRGPYLYVYPTQFSKKADLTVSVVRCVVTDATDLKTSKKFVFRVQRGSNSIHYFSCYSMSDMKTWMHKIIVASEIHSHGAGRVMSKSVSCMRSDSEGEPPNSPPGGSGEPCAAVVPPSPAHHTLPRNAHLFSASSPTSNSGVSFPSTTSKSTPLASLFAHPK